MRCFVLAATLAATVPLRGQAQTPNTDVYLAPLSRRGDSLVVGAAINVTQRAGYDNQPSFLLDGSAMLYTAVGADGQADIWRYDIASRRRTRVTSTPESEYSPTIMPGGRRFSVIRVERDSTQRLWSFSLGGTDPRLVLTALRPVGYHAWLDTNRIAAYVLGAPSTLHVLARDGSGDEVRARDIGRALSRIPAQDWYSFTQRDSLGALWIVSQPFSGGPPSRLIRAPADNEFHAWTPDGTLLTATGDLLVRWNRRSDDEAAWLPVAPLGGPTARGVTRLAVSPDGRWLAFVAAVIAP